MDQSSIPTQLRQDFEWPELLVKAVFGKKESQFFDGQTYYKTN